MKFLNNCNRDYESINVWELSAVRIHYPAHRDWNPEPSVLRTNTLRRMNGHLMVLISNFNRSTILRDKLPLSSVRDCLTPDTVEQLFNINDSDSKDYNIRVINPYHLLQTYKKQSIKDI